MEGLAARSAKASRKSLLLVYEPVLGIQRGEERAVGDGDSGASCSILQEGGGDSAVIGLCVFDGLFQSQTLPDSRRGEQQRDDCCDDALQKPRWFLQRAVLPANVIFT